MTEASRFVHATALVIGEAGVLIRGPSGSGKSSLAIRLIAEASLRGRFARLIGDDRVGITIASGVVILRPHPVIAGRVERRGLPIATVPFERGCVLKLVVDLLEAPLPRLPEQALVRTLVLDRIEVATLRLQSCAIELSCQFVLHELGLG